MEVDATTATDSILDDLKALAKQRYPNQQAPATAIEAVSAAAKLPLHEGLLLEEKLANEAKLTTESKAAIHVFFAERASRRVPGMPDDVKARKIEQAAIIGAGTMGGGIAICFANAGIPVTVLDIDDDALQRGIGVVSDTLESRVKRGRMSAGDKAERMALITGTTNYDDLNDADVIIEAAVEKMALKKQIFAQLDNIAKPGAVMALFGATLTLPGIAAVVLSVGMCVDGNILIYERIRDELRLGKSVRGAVDLGFTRAFSAILDGQLTTAAGGWVLLQYGSGPIKGFAVLLLVGVFTTLFVNTWVTRVFFDWYIAKKKGQMATISI
jgi:hypothetical protein